MPDLSGLSTLQLTRGQMIQWNNLKYFFAYPNRPRRLDDEQWRTVGVAADVSATAPSVANGSAGNVVGTFVYYMVGINKNVRLPDGSYPSSLPIGPTSEVSPNSHEVNITSVPSSHADANVTHWRFFRHRDGKRDTNLKDRDLEFFHVPLKSGETGVDDDGDLAIGTTSSIDDKKDTQLNDIWCNFSTNIPPAALFAEEFGGRLWCAGFTPITDGTATKNGTTTVNGRVRSIVDFTGITLPDGVIGAFFKKKDDDEVFVIMAVTDSDTVQLDREFTGTLSGSDYIIYRDQNALWCSEYNNYEAWGQEGEVGGTFRNRIFVGGSGRDLVITGVKRMGDMMYIFTRNEIWGMNMVGYGTSLLHYRVSKSPLFSDIGNIGQSSSPFEVVGRELYFMSARGPAVLAGGQVEEIGRTLGSTFLEDVNPDKLSLSAVGYCPKENEVLFACPQNGDTTNSQDYVYRRDDGSWWRNLDVFHTCFARLLDSDTNAVRLFAAVGGFKVMINEGFADGVPDAEITNQRASGTATSGTSTSLTDTTKTYYTTGDGYKRRMIYFVHADNTIEKRQITSNTADTISWSGALTTAVTAGTKYFIGSVWMNIKTRVWSPAAQKLEIDRMSISYDLQGETNKSYMYARCIINETEKSWVASQITNARKDIPGGPFKGDKLQLQLQVRDVGAQVAIQDITPIMIPGSGDAKNTEA